MVFHQNNKTLTRTHSPHICLSIYYYSLKSKVFMVFLFVCFLQRSSKWPYFPHLYHINKFQIQRKEYILSLWHEFSDYEEYSCFPSLDKFALKINHSPQLSDFRFVILLAFWPDYDLIIKAEAASMTGSELCSALSIFASCLVLFCSWPAFFLL